MPWFNTNINFPAFSDFEDCETEEEFDKWIEEMNAAAREVSDGLNYDMRRFVCEAARGLLNGIENDSHTDVVCYDDDDIEDGVQVLFDKNKDLKRVLIDQCECDSYVENQETGFRHYTYTFDVYERGNNKPYYLTVHGENTCDEYAHCGYPQSDLYVTLCDKNDFSVDKSKWKDILGHKVEYNTAFVSDVLEDNGFEYTWV